MYHFSRSRVIFVAKNGNWSIGKKTYDNNLSGFRLYKDGVKFLPYGGKATLGLAQPRFLCKKTTDGRLVCQFTIDWGVRFDMAANKGIIVDKANQEGLEDNVGRRQLFRSYNIKLNHSRHWQTKIILRHDLRMIKPEFEYGSYTFTITRMFPYSLAY